jgi:hypothetical protein
MGTEKPVPLIKTGLEGLFEKLFWFFGFVQFCFV